MIWRLRSQNWFCPCLEMLNCDLYVVVSDEVRKPPKIIRSHHQRLFVLFTCVRKDLLPFISLFCLRLFSIFIIILFYGRWKMPVGAGVAHAVGSCTVQYAINLPSPRAQFSFFSFFFFLVCLSFGWSFSCWRSSLKLDPGPAADAMGDEQIGLERASPGKSKKKGRGGKKKIKWKWTPPRGKNPIYARRP